MIASPFKISQKNKTQYYFDIHATSGLTGDKFAFNDQGDGPVRYNIIHYKQISPGKFKWITVGSYWDGRMTLKTKGTLA